MPSECLTIENIPYAVVLIDKQGVIVDVNKELELLSGFEKESIQGENIENLFTRHFSQTSFIQQFGQEKHLKVEHYLRLQCVNSDIKPCIVKLTKFNDLFLVYVDHITSVPQLAGEHHTLDFVNNRQNFEEAFWQWDIKSGVIHCSAQAMEVLGYPSESFVGKATFWEKHVAPQDMVEIYRQVKLHFKGELPFINVSCPVYTVEEEVRWVSVIGKIFDYQNDKPHRIFGSVKDISDSKRLIQQYEKQKRYLHIAERLDNSGHWRVDLTTNEMFWSDGVFDIYGLSSENYVPAVDSSFELYFEEEREKARAYYQQSIETKEGFRFKSVIRHALGKKVKIECLGDVELDNNGDVIAVFGVIRDITKSEEVFEKLKLLALVNYTIKVPIFFIDDKDNVVYQDISSQQHDQKRVLFNYINFSINDYLHYKRQAKEKGQVKQKNISFDKYHSVFDLSVTYERDEGIYIWIVENVTDKFRKEQQQIISNRLALLGNTFGNVSHDINNVLGVALGATEMLEIKVSQGERDISRYVERVKNAIDKGKSVTERLLAFTRKPPVKVIEFDPISEVEENLYLFKQMLLSTIEFSFTKLNSNCHITFPQGEFINILLNIVLNAQDAIKEREVNGKIQMSAQVIDGNRFEIKVKDSGIGIKEENLSKIFDPFYSSKSLNKGNGIGLANVYSTMYKHNGEIQVSGTSDLGGAEFTLVFRCKSFNTAIGQNSPTISSAGIENHSYLILDDEISIAEFVSLYLDSEGATTNHVTSKAALEGVLKGSQTYDVFITDMILPDISGREAVALVKERYPNIKVLSMSGYIAEQEHEWEYPVLRKPFNSKELVSFLMSN